MILSTQCYTHCPLKKDLEDIHVCMHSSHKCIVNINQRQSPVPGIGDLNVSKKELTLACTGSELNNSVLKKLIFSCMPSLSSVLLIRRKKAEVACWEGSRYTAQKLKRGWWRSQATWPFLWACIWQPCPVGASSLRSKIQPENWGVYMMQTYTIKPTLIESVFALFVETIDPGTTMKFHPSLSFLIIGKRASQSKRLSGSF